MSEKSFDRHGFAIACGLFTFLLVFLFPLLMLVAEMIAGIVLCVGVALVGLIVVVCLDQLQIVAFNGCNYLQTTFITWVIIALIFGLVNAYRFVLASGTPGQAVNPESEI